MRIIGDITGMMGAAKREDLKKMDNIINDLLDLSEMEFSGDLIERSRFDLKGGDVHLIHMPASGDEAGLRKLRGNLTSEPHSATKSFFAV